MLCSFPDDLDFCLVYVIASLSVAGVESAVPNANELGVKEVQVKIPQNKIEVLMLWRIKIKVPITPLKSKSVDAF